MTFDEYQEQALSTLLTDHAYGDISAQLMAQVLGLVGESGEIAEKFKKLIRDKDGRISDDDKKEIIKEMGDILWYVSTVSHLLGADMTDVAQANIDKLASRKDRGVLKGSGDNR